MKLTFYLMHPERERTNIMIYIGYLGKNKRISIKMSVESKYWDDDLKRVKVIRGTGEQVYLNSNLSTIENGLRQFESNSRMNGKQVTISDLAKKLNELIGVTDKKEQLGLYQFIEQFIKNRSEMSTYSPDTIKVYKTAYNHLKKYFKKRVPDFDDLDKDFFAGFTKYLYGQEYKPNFVHKIFSNIKMMLLEAESDGIEINSAVKQRNLMPKLGVSRQSDITRVYLTQEELKNIAGLQLSGFLENTRDCFLIGCYTGLRYSDYSNVKASNIQKVDNMDVIVIVTQKTNQKVYIPIHPFIRTILDKNDGYFPKASSNQKTNEGVKKICRLAGITQKVVLTEYKGGRNKRTDEEVEKWELVSSHTARRTFATNMYLSGDVPTRSIMAITGHKTEKSFMHYIVLDNQEHSSIVSLSKFFKE